jgi:hypothetical protein
LLAQPATADNYLEPDTYLLPDDFAELKGAFDGDVITRTFGETPQTGSYAIGTKRRAGRNFVFVVRHVAGRLRRCETSIDAETANVVFEVWKRMILGPRSTDNDPSPDGTEHVEVDGWENFFAVNVSGRMFGAQKWVPQKDDWPNRMIKATETIRSYCLHPRASVLRDLRVSLTVLLDQLPPVATPPPSRFPVKPDGSDPFANVRVYAQPPQDKPK